MVRKSCLDLFLHVPGLRKSGLLTVGEAAVMEGGVKLREDLG